MEKREVVMKLAVWDRAFVIRDDAVFSCEIIKVRFEEDEEMVDKSFVVERSIPRGLFDEDVRRETYKEDELFLDKKEAKEFLANLKEARKVVNKYDDRYVSGASWNPYWTSILDLYRDFTNNK